MKILVTGAAGNLGRALLVACRGRHEVVAVDVAPLPADLAGADHVRSITGDVFDEALLREAAVGCDAICHTAALHGGHLATRSHAQFIQTNVVGSDMFCRVMLALGIGRMAFSSTSEITIGRGWNASGPMVITDQTPPAPDTIYPLSKLMAEQVYAFHASMHGLRVACLRYCGFGYIPEGKAGAQLVSRYLEPSDVAEANLCCLESDHIRFEVFYVAPVSPLTGPDMAVACRDPEAILEKHWPGSVELLRGAGFSTNDPLWPSLDVTRLRQVTGWEPAVTFDALLAELRRRAGSG